MLCAGWKVELNFVLLATVQRNKLKQIICFPSYYLPTTLAK